MRPDNLHFIFDIVLELGLSTMAATNPHQLYLLADHVKLSLLERQRAASLNIEGNKQDGHIKRSLETLREGVEGLKSQLAEE